MEGVKPMDEKIAEHGVAIERHEQQIKTLFARQEELDRLTQSVNDLALSVRGMVERMTSMERRVNIIEDEARSRVRTIWACVATGIIGAAIAFLMSSILK